MAWSSVPVRSRIAAAALIASGIALGTFGGAAPAWTTGVFWSIACGVCAIPYWMMVLGASPCAAVAITAACGILTILIKYGAIDLVALAVRYAFRNRRGVHGWIIRKTSGLAREVRRAKAKLARRGSGRPARHRRIRRWLSGIAKRSPYAAVFFSGFLNSWPGILIARAMKLDTMVCIALLAIANTGKIIAYGAPFTAALLYLKERFFG